RIKIRHGCAMAAMVDASETIEVSSVGGRGARSIPRHTLVGIIEPRMEEIFRLVHNKITESGYAELLGAGVVLTGGATLLEGTPELAESVLGLPVRRGVPMGVGGMNEMVKGPQHATAVGLLKYGATRPPAVVTVASASREVGKTGQHRAAAGGDTGPVSAGPGFGSKLWGWVREVF
ncbi:MAG: cell division FtsA domain-containing protein, partial [Deltaproteobacteria bacterium]